MKKFVSIFLILCLIFGLMGCSSTAGDTTADTAESTAEPTETETQATEETAPQEDVVAQLPMFAVSLPLISEKTYADDGREIFSLDYQNISLTVTDPEIADKIILDFLNRTDIHEDVQYILELAKTTASGEGAYNNPLFAGITYNPVRLDSSVLSMFGIYSTYSGGAHGEYIFKSVTYDLVNGEPLTLGSILTENADINSICNQVISSLSSQKEDKMLFDGFEDTVKDRFSRNYKQMTDWYLSDTGLCFFYSPYEIAPFSAGEVIAEIPYEQLTGILKDDYFPAERESVSGTVTAEMFDESASDRFTQFAELTLSKDSEKVLLYTDKSVYDVRIQVVSWLADGTSYSVENTVFAAYTLTPGDAIVIETLLSETMPSLMLSYKTGDQTVHSLLTYDGREGTISLKDA